MDSSESKMDPIITADPEAVKERKFVLPEEKYNSTNFLTLWDFEGVFKYSPLFYGWYTNRDYNDSAVFNSIDRKNNHGHGYRLPFAYFVTGLVVYAYSFFATLRKMAENSRMSKLSEKDDECIFSWKLFTAWDYMIGNAETAHNRVASIVMGFKEALLEEAEKKRESRNWKVICFRVLVNTLVVGLLSCSAFAVVIVVKRSTDPEANSTVWRRNEITVVMSLITLFFPMLFEVLGFVEQYHPRKQLRLQLARIMVLNLLNLYSLIFALFDKITDMTVLLQAIKTNLSKPQTTDIAYYTTTPMPFEVTQTSDESTSTIQCFCNDSSMAMQTVVSLDLLSDLAQNLSALAMPTLNSLAKTFYNNNITEGILNSVDDPFLNTSESYFNSSLISSGAIPFPIENSTDYFANSSLSWYENLTSVTNASELNMELPDFADVVKDRFVDYLTFMLSPFIVVNSSDFGFSNYSNLTVNDSIIIENVTLDSVNFTDYEYFKSTLLPLFNNTWPEEDQRFDVELTSLFEEISTTISSLPDILTASVTTDISTDMSTENTEYSQYCQNYCNTMRDLKAKTTGASTVTSTALTTVSYGEVEYRKILNYKMNAKLRSLCWETMFGQELIKLTVMDLIVTGLSILMMDFFRGIFVRVMNRCWCWDLEKKFPQYGDFKVAENILHLVNNQGMVWMGMFFSPGLVVLNVVKLYIMMYLRTWAVLTCNVPHEIIFRASRSNNFYYALLLMMLFLCVLPVGYAIVWIEPSWHCGPFSGYQKIFHIFTKTIRANVPESMHRALDYIASPGIVIPLLLLLVLIIYYLISLTGALREANNDLKTQLRRERTEERRKMFQLADRRRRGGSGESADQTPFSKWKKLLVNLPSTRSCDDARQESEDIIPSQRDEEEEEDEKVENKGRVFFTKLIKKALGKSSTSEEEQDGTDTDQHDSLPYDNSRQASKEHKPLSKTSSGGVSDIQTVQGIVSKWSLRRHGHKDEKGKHIEEKISMKDDNKISSPIDKGKTAHPSDHPMLHSKISDLKDYATIKDKEKTPKVFQEGRHDEKGSKDPKSVLKIHKISTPKLTRDEIINIDYDASQGMSNSRGSTQNKDHQKHSRDKKHVQKPEKEGNVFLKRIIEAKKLGAFDARSEKAIEEQPKLRHDVKEQRMKGDKRNKSKTRKVIMELDEDNFDQEPSTSQNMSEINIHAHKKSAERQDSSSSTWSDTIPVITISKTYSDENILEKEDVMSKVCKRDKTNRNDKKYSKNSDVTQTGEKCVPEGAFPKKDRGRRFVFRDKDPVSSSDESDGENRGTKSLNYKNENSKSLAEYLDKLNESTSFRPRVKCVLKKQATAIDEDIIIHFGDDLRRVEAEKQMILDMVNEKVAENRGFNEYPNLPSTSYHDSIFDIETSDNCLEPLSEGRSSKLEGGSASDRSTSDDTELKEDNSVDTILNSPYYATDASDKLSPVTGLHEERDRSSSVESPMELEMEGINFRDDYGGNEESLEIDVEDYSETGNRNVLELQRPSVKSSSRSQTESSSYYNE